MNTPQQKNGIVLVNNINFNEKDYLTSNPDVDKAVQEGAIFSGRVHFIIYGRKEGRKMRITLNTTHQSKLQQLYLEITTSFLGAKRVLFRYFSKLSGQKLSKPASKKSDIPFSDWHKQNEAIHEHAGRFHLPDGGEINYQIIGQEGPWVSVIQGGRHSLTETKSFSQKIASKGYKVVIHDRRNCGQSSLEFNNQEPEDNFWADDLYALLIHLNAKPAFVIGRSRGIRIATKLILRHPGIVNRVVFWGISGGPIAVRFLKDYYYEQYLRACNIGGMEAVCALEHFAGLIAARPENKEALLALNPVSFIATMTSWRDAFLIGENLPVMGISDEELQKINIPVLIVPKYNKMHPYTSSIYAHQMIPNSILFDFDPLRSKNENTRSVSEILSDEEKVVEIITSTV